MKKNTLLSVAAMAGMMFIGQGAFAQQSATDSDRASSQSNTGQSNTGQRNTQSSSGSSTSSQDRSSDSSSSADRSGGGQSDSATTAGARGQQRGSARGQSSKEMDQKFVECASAMDQFEIQAAQLAEQQAQDDQIKSFAKQIRQDHEQTSKQLQQIAQQAGLPVSQQLKPPQQAMLQELKQMQGEEFDKAYAYGNVAGHTIAVLKFRDAARQSQNPQLKQFAQQTLPKLQQHLQHAQQLAQWDDASAQTAGSRIPAAGDRTGSNRSDSSSGASGTGTRDAGSPGSSSSQQGGRNDTGSGSSSDSSSGGRSPSR